MRSQRRADRRDTSPKLIGVRTPELRRRYDINKNTFYKWKCKYASMQTSDVRRLRQLVDRSGSLKMLLVKARWRSRQTTAFTLGMNSAFCGRDPRTEIDFLANALGQVDDALALKPLSYH